MSYYPNPPNQGDNYPVGYNPYPNPGQNGNAFLGYNRPAPFPVDPSEQLPPAQGYPYPPPQGYAQPPFQGYPPQGYPQPGSHPPQSHYQGHSQPYGQGYGQPGYGGPPIITQPGVQPGGDWMNIPQEVPNCPPGLEYLMPLSSLFVKEKVDVMEVVTGMEGQNKFTIKNDRGEKIYWAVEESNWLNRNCFPRLHAFDLKIMDRFQNEVIRLTRPCRCDSCCFPCSVQEIRAYAPPGNFIGSIRQVNTCINPEFSIKDASGQTVLKIQGNGYIPFLWAPTNFKILSRDKNLNLGEIRKEWSGFVREFFTESDCFGATFPQDLDVRMKAVILGGIFLIDAKYFSSSFF